jgi:hypothetical protein
MPEALRTKLFGKEKAAAAKVTVEPEGNSFRIIKIDMAD